VRRILRALSSGRERAPATGGAPFGTDPIERERLDWRILEQGACALYYKPAVLAEDVAWLQAQGYTVHALDCARWSSPAAMHGDLKAALGFPSHYAANLASLIDALAEMEVPAPGGMAVQLRRFDTFAGRDRDFAHTLLDVLETTSRGFLLTGRRFIALVQSDNPRISFERVGARPVNWNPREWLESARGLGGER
jgi:hypothetical protein